MKKMSYPAKEPMLVIRTCVKAICCWNKPASKLLAVLLYWYDHSTEECPDNIFTIYRTQEQLATDAVDELTTRTIHDTAIPMLIALGYLDVIESPKGNYYTVYIDKINEALTAYGNKNPQILQALIQKNVRDEYEKFRILDSVLNTKNFEFNTKNFVLELEEFLITIRRISNSKRGRKPAIEQASKAKKKRLENIETNRDYKRENANASKHTSKKNHLKVVRSKPEQQKLGTSGIALSEDEQRIYEYWSKIHDFQSEVTTTMKERFAQLAPVIASYEEMKSLYDYVRGLKFMNGKAVKPGNLTNSYTDWKSLQTKPSTSTNGNKPNTDIYTQASLDPEIRQRNIDRLKAKAKAKADEQAEQERQLKAAQ